MQVQSDTQLSVNTLLTPNPCPPPFRHPPHDRPRSSKASRGCGCHRQRPAAAAAAAAQWLLGTGVLLAAAW